MNKYRVRFYMDDLYEIVLVDDEAWGSIFQGTIVECEAWLRLKEGGYL